MPSKLKVREEIEMTELTYYGTKGALGALAIEWAGTMLFSFSTVTLQTHHSVVWTLTR